MYSQPTPASAALAGIWTGIGFVAFKVMSDKAAEDSLLNNDLVWLAVFAIFLAVPAIYFVFGRRGLGLSKNWINVPEERARYFLMVKRMGVWVASAAASGAVFAFFLNQSA